MNESVYPEWMGKKISTNEQGFDFFVDTMTNKEAQSKLGKESHTLIVGKGGTLMTRLLCYKTMDIFSTTSAEAMGTHIYMLYALKTRGTNLKKKYEKLLTN